VFLTIIGFSGYPFHNVIRFSGIKLEPFPRIRDQTAMSRSRVAGHLGWAPDHEAADRID